MSVPGFSVGVTLECICGARIEGTFPTRRLKALLRAFSKAHHHPPTRDALGRFARWSPA